MVAHRPEIDGLRAVAITSVVLFHSGSGFFSGGYIGVDIFFVISGYLITSIIWQERCEGRFSFTGFYIRRARRILPALLFMLAVVTVFCFALYFPNALVEYGKVLIYTVFFGANLRLAAAAGYFDAWNQNNVLIHMWSLAIEEQFYFIWPALLVLVSALVGLRRTKLLVLLLFAASFVCSEVLVHFWPRVAFYHLPARSWELLAGALLALNVVPCTTSRRVAEGLSVLGAILMIAPIFAFTKYTTFPGATALAPVMGCVLVIYSETHVRTQIGNLLRLRPVVFIGLISYSLYLWHWPALAIPHGVLFRELTSAETALAVAIAFALSTFSWKYVEQPFRLQKHTPLPLAGSKPALISPLSALALSGLLVLSGSLFQKYEGLAWRFSTATRNLLPQPRRQPWKEACSSFTRSASGLGICKVGNTGDDEPGAFVLWGDSHVGNYLQALADIYKTGTVFIYHGCTPLLGITWVGPKKEPLYASCEQAKREAIDRLQALKPNLVLIAARWSYSEETPYGLEERPRGFFLSSVDEEVSVETSRRAFAKALPATIAQILEIGARIVLLAQVPETKQNSRSCAAALRHIGLSDHTCEAIERSEVESRLGRINALLAKVASTQPHVRVFWPIPHMCDDKYCYAIRDGIALYEDGDHLSPEGTKYIGSYLKNALPPAMALHSDSGGPHRADLR